MKNRNNRFTIFQKRRKTMKRILKIKKEEFLKIVMKIMEVN
jgi:hypothetical protein